MNKKKLKILGIIIAFAICFPLHFLYDKFPNFITSIFSPVNESIWEHMKIIYTCILLSSLIEYLIYKKENIKFNNFILNIPITSILSILIYLIIYLPLELLFGHSLFLATLLLFIVFIISQIISYYILNIKEIKHQDIIGVILIILSYIIFIFLMYNPFKNHLFIDSRNNTYGINNKKKKE